MIAPSPIATAVERMVLAGGRGVDGVAMGCAIVAFAAARAVAGYYAQPLFTGLHAAAFMMPTVAPHLAVHGSGTQPTSTPSTPSHESQGVMRWLVDAVFGEAASIMLDDAGTIQRKCLSLHSRGAVAFRSFHADRLMVVDPRDAEYILVDRPHTFVKGERYRMLRLLLGNGLVTIEDEAEHAVHRRAISPSFSTAAVRRFAEAIFAPHFHKHVNGLAAGAAKGDSSPLRKVDETPQELQKGFDQATLEIISEAAFRTTRFETLGSIMTATRFAPSPLLLLPSAIFSRLPTAMRRNAREARKAIGEQIKSTLAEARREGPPVDGTGKSLVDYLAFSPELPDKLLLDQAVTFVFAGHDTTSTALNWALVYLARHPHVQSKLYEELREGLARDAVPTLENVESLPYLRNVVKELLRVQPPVYHVIRQAAEDELLPHSGVFIAKGAQVFVSVWGIHHNPAVWGADADEFRPERWEDAGLVDRVGPCGWMPFLVGKRNCIGKDFAMTELLVALALLMRRLEVVWPEGQPAPRPKPGPIVRPRDEVKFVLRRRAE